MREKPYLPGRFELVLGCRQYLFHAKHPVQTKIQTGKRPKRKAWVFKMTDKQIVELYFERDERAIRETNKKYGAYCFRIADNILHNREDAEECVNDTWMKTWDAVPPAKPVYLNLFLAKIVRNLSFNRYQAKHAQKRGGGEMALVLEELEDCIAGLSDVEARYIAKELNTIINRFAHSLPERECNIFIRRYFYAEPLRDIARRYCLSHNAVAVSLSRTRKKLQKRLEKEGYFL